MSFKDALESGEVQGEIKFVGDKIYKKVKNVDTIAQAYGYPVCYSFGGGSGEYVDQPATARLSAFAGIVNNPVSQTDTDYTIPAGEWGWICVQGQVEAYVDATTAITDGCSLKTADSSSKMVEDEAAGTEPSYYNHAVALEALASGTGYIDAFVKAFL